jgi:transcriptional regulator with XRE-family HTH domain
MDDIGVIIGENLKRLRELRELSQTEVGEMIGVTYQQVYKYEQGIDRISAKSLGILSRKMHVYIADFYVGVLEVIPIAESKFTLKAAKAFENIKSEIAKKKILELMYTLH